MQEQTPPYPSYSRTYTRYQRQHFIEYNAFKLQLPRGHCSFCTKILYQDEIFFLEYYDSIDNLTTARWNLETTFNKAGQIATCKEHQRRNQGPFPNYPGPSIDHIHLSRTWSIITNKNNDSNN